jgi:hypothetical protein
VQRPTLTARRPGRSAGRAKETVFEIEHKTDEGQKICCLANSLTTKAPYKGLGADSEEKREPASDIDTVVVDSLKALDPKWPIREVDVGERLPTGVADDEAGPLELHVGSPRRTRAAGSAG